MFKHTPWRVTERSGAIRGLDIMCGNIRIAAVSIANPKAAKHAVLIAAAPDLLGALREARHFVGSESFNLRLMNEIDAILAKLEG
jgi:hypothetical protein